MKKLRKPSVAELKKWDKILKESGFKDIEYRLKDGSVSDLLSRPSNTLGKDIADKYDERLETSLYSGRLLHSGRIPEEDYKIWELHCEGLSIRAICGELDLKFEPVRLSVKRTTKLLNTYIKECEAENPREVSESWEYQDDLNPWGYHDDEEEFLDEDDYKELKF